MMIVKLTVAVPPAAAPVRVRLGVFGFAGDGNDEAERCHRDCYFGAIPANCCVCGPFDPFKRNAAGLSTTIGSCVQLLNAKAETGPLIGAVPYS